MRQRALPDIRVAALRREALRIAAAFLVYLLLGPLWTASGLAAGYDALVLGIAGAIYLPLQHFPALTTLDDISVVHLDFAVLFAVSLALVTIATPWRRRVKNLAIVLVAMLALHVVTVMLQIKVTSTLDLNRQYGLLILLPAEFAVVERAKYLLYDFGLQAVPFVLVLLTVDWGRTKWGQVFSFQSARTTRWGLSWGQVFSFQSALHSTRSTQGRRLKTEDLTPVVVAVVLVAVAWFGWSRWRETRPLHVGAHARLGRLYQDNRNLQGATEQYRIAVAGDTDDPRVFLDLAGILAQSGDRAGARELLTRGRERSTNPEWQVRFDRALATIGG